MSRNKLMDLNNHLFETLERLNDDECMQKDGDNEIRRAKAVTGIASQIIALGNLALSAQKYKDEYGSSELRRSSRCRAEIIMARRYTPEQITFLRENVHGRTARDLTVLFNAEFGLELTEENVKALKTNYGLKSGTPRHGPPKYQPEHIEFLKANVVGRTEKELLEMFNAKFGLEVNVNVISNLKVKYGLHSGVVGGRFRKGQSPSNKGKRWNEYMSPERQAAARATTFKPGQIPHNYMPVGSERINSDGYHDIKIADPNKWRSKHVLLWEAAHGPVPRGSCLIFLDGNKDNVAIENLALISRAELVRLNQKGLIYDNAEATKSGIIVARIMTQMGRRLKKSRS